MNNRTDKLRAELSKLDAQAMIVSYEPNIRYFSGFTGEGCLVVSDEKAVILTDSRYTVQASRQSPDYVCDMIDQSGVYAAAASKLREWGAKRVLIEADCLTVAAKESLESAAGDIEYVNTQGIGTRIRAVKDAEERELILKAGAITDDCLQFVFAKAQRGMSELELAAELTYYMATKHGCEPAFAHIVASGINGSMPHAIPSERRFEEGDLVTLDFGVIYKGYRSDMTRTFAMGKPQARLCEIYDIVYEAQSMAQKALKPGAKCADIDAIARDHIRKAGYGDCFGHGLGHGVGIEIHESPRFSPKSTQVLESGMVVTVEPGIYVEGLGGVRIENTCIITENSYVNIFKSPTHMVQL